MTARVLLIILSTAVLYFASPARAAQPASPAEEAVGSKPAAEETVGGKTEPTASAAGADQEQDAQKITQSIYPGVKNMTLKRGGDGSPVIELNYPAFANEKVNAIIVAYIKKLASEYEEDIKSEPDEAMPDSYDMWEMSGTYTIEYANPRIVSAIFNIYNYSGGAHGMITIACMDFNLESGAELTFDNLFSDPAKALAILSEGSIVKLRRELGDEADEEMIVAGAAPEKGNFANLILQEDGLTVQFQPYQVGPWSIGPQTVKFSLEELAAAGPNPEIWPKKSE